jgi:hypothetical protein
VHYTLHFDHRKRRIRRSLRTRDLERAIELRDELFAHIREHGEFVASKREDPGFSRLLMASETPVAPAWWLVDA